MISDLENIVRDFLTVNWITVYERHRRVVEEFKYWMNYSGNNTQPSTFRDYGG